jgi:hypothetical protein
MVFWGFLGISSGVWAATWTDDQENVNHLSGDRNEHSARMKTAQSDNSEGA